MKQKSNVSFADVSASVSDSNKVMTTSQTTRVRVKKRRSPKNMMTRQTLITTRRIKASCRMPLFPSFMEVTVKALSCAKRRELAQ